MNILYISKLDGRPWIGPTYSVPMQIAAQAQFDNVFWYNMCSNRDGITEHLENWRKLSYYADLLNYPTGRIADLPAPFCDPDLIIVEQGYPFVRDRQLLKEISQHKFVLIPRGELTSSAQKKKRLKKVIGNIVTGFPQFTRKALAIQCLTKHEEEETGQRWNRRKLVFPNGTTIPDLPERDYCKNGIVFRYVGRLEAYQKGLDLLFDACALIKEEMRSKACMVYLHGTAMEASLETLKSRVEELGISDFISFQPAVYNEDKARCLKESDVFLMPSRFEGHPTGLLEALAYGLPCVVTTGTNMRDEVEASDAGWTADPSAESLKNALLRAINETQQYAEKGCHARELAKRYEWAAIAKEAHTAYAEMLQ